LRDAITLEKFRRLVVNHAVDQSFVITRVVVPELREVIACFNQSVSILSDNGGNMAVVSIPATHDYVSRPCLTGRNTLEFARLIKSVVHVPRVSGAQKFTVPRRRKRALHTASAPAHRALICHTLSNIDS